MSTTQHTVSTSSNQGLQLLAESITLSPIESEEEILFSSEELGKALGFQEPRKAINKIFERNRNELKHYSTDVKLTSVDGSLRNTRAFTREGALIVSMLARTNNAKAVRAWLARLGDRVIAEAEQKGYLAGRGESAAEILAYKPFWKEIKRYRELGLSLREIALLLGKGESTIFRNLRRMEAAGIFLLKETPVGRRQLSLFGQGDNA